jgi:hypothetical protein
MELLNEYVSKKTHEYKMSELNSQTKMMYLEYIRSHKTTPFIRWKQRIGSLFSTKHSQ